VVAIETADHGITCNAICPGWVMTPLVAQQVQARANAAGQSFEVAEQEFVAEKQPMARYTRPEDIGARALFLAGGWTAQ
jgi:3-hydroxybutyrate dehydrogenase